MSHVTKIWNDIRSYEDTVLEHEKRFNLCSSRKQSALIQPRASLRKDFEKEAIERNSLEIAGGVGWWGSRSAGSSWREVAKRRAAPPAGLNIRHLTFECLKFESRHRLTFHSSLVICTFTHCIEAMTLHNCILLSWKPLG